MIRRPRSRRSQLTGIACGLASILTLACFRLAEKASPELGPARGYLLLVLGGARADALSLYGNDAATPFLASLAKEALVFDWAIAASPQPLPAQTSLMTSLYASEHGVQLPEHELSRAVGTFTEHLSAHGFHTAGHTAGGFLTPRFAFHRGFDVFTVEDSAPRARAVLERGLHSLDELRRRDRFFLFLHLGPVLTTSDPDAQSPHRSRYADAARALDRELERFFVALDKTKVRREMTILIVGDRGHSLGENRPSEWPTTYLENVRVPFIILSPDGRHAGRSSRLAETVDVGPTLVHLAGLPPLPSASGENVVDLGRGAADDGSWAYAEASGWARQESVLFSRAGRLQQLVQTTYREEPDGTWVSGRASFDAADQEMSLDVVAFHRPREIAVAVNGDERQPLLATTRWKTFRLGLDPQRSRSRVSLATASCDSPRALGLSKDPRCLSFKVRGVDLTRTELFDLTEDPLGTVDRFADANGSRELLTELLLRYRLRVIAQPLWRRLDPDTEAGLAALGYLP